MSFSGGNTTALPAEDPNYAGIPANWLPSNQGANPVPYGAGSVRMGFTFLEDIFDLQLVPAEPSGSSGLVGTSGGIYNYIATIWGLIGIGPFDRLTIIYFDQTVVWQGDLRRSDPGNTDFVTVTTSGGNTITLYWGTETQPQDTYMQAHGPNAPYPAYRGQCHFVAYNLNWGTSSQPPSITFGLWRWPAPDWFSGLTGEVDGDANPVAILGEFLQHPRVGIGLPDSRLDTTGLLVTANTLANECVGLSPNITSQDKLTTFLATLMQLVDGYLRRLPTGLISMGLIRPVPQNTVLPILDESCFTDEISPDPQSWEETSAATLVSFINRDNNWLPDGLVGIDISNLLNTSEWNTQQFDGSWISRAALANVIANAMARISGVPQTNFTGILTRSAGSALYVGATFRLSYGHYGMVNVICRVTDLTLDEPTKGTISISFRIDTANQMVPFGTPAPIAEQTIVTVQTEPFVYSRLFEAPYIPVIGHRPTLLPLAARPTLTTVALQVFLESLGGMYAEVYRAVGGFAKRGHLTAAYGITPVIDGLIGLAVTMDGVDATLPIGVDLSDCFAYPLFIIIDDEIMYGWGISGVGGVYTVFVVRSRLSTQIAAHANGAEVWFCQANSMMLPFPIPAGAPLEPLTGKMVPESTAGLYDIPSVTPDVESIQMLALRPPPAANLSLASTGWQTSIGVAGFTAGQDITTSWSATTEEGPDTWSDYTTDLPDCWLEIYTTAGVIKQSLFFPASTLDSFGRGSVTLTAAQRTSILGSDTSFIVKAWQARNTNRAIQPAVLTAYQH